MTVINPSPAPVDLTGWRRADRLKRSCPVPPGPVAAGATLTVTASDGMQLGNNGGAITLLDAAGTKVHGVSYTGDQVRREGWTAVFWASSLRPVGIGAGCAALLSGDVLRRLDHER